MSRTLLRGRVMEPSRGELRVGSGSAPEPAAAFWRINGYRAKLLIWTRDEWERMESPPPDAQLHPCGVWCALRLESSSSAERSMTVLSVPG
jgi:hypothetical protein